MSLSVSTISLSELVYVISFFPKLFTASFKLLTLSVSASILSIDSCIFVLKIAIPATAAAIPTAISVIGFANNETVKAFVVMSAATAAALYDTNAFFAAVNPTIIAKRVVVNVITPLVALLCSCTKLDSPFIIDNCKELYCVKAGIMLSPMFLLISRFIAFTCACCPWYPFAISAAEPVNIAASAIIPLYTACAFSACVKASELFPILTAYSSYILEIFFCTPAASESTEFSILIPSVVTLTASDKV